MKLVQISEYSDWSTYQGWFSVGGREMFFKSLWEKRYCLYLELLKRNGKIKEWWYEPDQFVFDRIKKGTKGYLPDFKVLFNSGAIEYIEIKGYMDKKSATKIKRMRIYHPGIKLRIIGKEWFNENGAVLKSVIKDW
jgi:hypothetical protein